ncbi:LCP family protein [Anaerotignum lactatifermentans]|uniref:LCP family protein n=1 Tax=Anaerotignum lactatifermentans TaxID=160404 RepID=A0ABS2GA60_9FIRM|nr:LCP family protein [Anaerotignum lactatifermentans]MBM6829874.1 LCP family protein [Anaerotignum lactatifermentans]MBM6878376.1 LCP family protein [Anaerotignum lactatifermentans]MBM6951531.1 LCP family protein [Anaerotignum lactatifermentans]
MKRKQTGKKKKRTLKGLYFKTLLITLAILLALLAGAYAIFADMLSGIKRTDVDESQLAVNEDLAGNGKITNIALYGVSSRDDSYVGLSDSIMVVSVNGKTGQIKLVSIARDTYVSVNGHGKTKLNHAYSYGGPELAIRTLNENFHLDITDFVAVNFDTMADVIDRMGGVDIEITEKERQQINAYLLEGEPVTETGLVHLNGPQAVSYSRIRKIDSDDVRTQRQRTVLQCLFEKAKTISPLEYPSLIKDLSPMVETSLTNQEILSLASVGANPGLSLTMDAFPNDYIESHGETISAVWYYIYDIEQAADMLHQFIYEDVPFSDYGKTEEELAAESGDTQTE